MAIPPTSSSICELRLRQVCFQGEQDLLAERQRQEWGPLREWFESKHPGKGGFGRARDRQWVVKLMFAQDSETLGPNCYLGGVTSQKDPKSDKYDKLLWHPHYE